MKLKSDEEISRYNWRAACERTSRGLQTSSGLLSGSAYKPTGDSPEAPELVHNLINRKLSLTSQLHSVLISSHVVCH